MSEQRIKELAEIPFEGSLEQAFSDYATALKKLSQQLAFEYEMAAGDSQAAMSRLHGNPLLLGLDAKLQARRVAKRLRRANELAKGLETEGRKFAREYRKQFLYKKG
ncbi:hypothetical protein [Nocardiopsis baichengensis]|uniref:hypothetical protein n=1 Tax=Nocardiopsis baichengensis TaxID=280240 RepID=UPI00034B2032|nr:hypothetical protein [Nocardiopsis baichengensis]